MQNISDVELKSINDVVWDINYNPKARFAEYGKVFIDVENMNDFILRTKDKKYVLDFQKLLEDYGVEV